MRTMRWLPACAAMLGLAMPLYAQVPAAPATDAAKKEANKDPSKKDQAKKPAPTKPAPKKAPAGDKDKKKVEINKPTKPSNVGELRDEKGNVIPISPDAYDVSSALPAKPKK